MNETVAVTGSSLSALNLATLMAALIVMVVVVFYAMAAVRAVKAEFAKVKDALGKVANGTLKEPLPEGSFKESAELLAYIARLAENLQRQREAITILAFSDHLTSLANRMRFEDELARGFNFAKRGLSICVVRLNVASFSEVNDRLGRETGDHALKVLANVLRLAIRKTDVAARLSDDDFALILPNMETSKIDEWLRQLQQRYDVAQRADEQLKTLEPRQLKTGTAFIDPETDKDFRDAWERANKALDLARAA
jgi:diguanylate cyclase (GGDEF)-like protein